MARVMIYRASSSLLAVDGVTDEVDPLELPIKQEPGSPLMESLLHFPEVPYEVPEPAELLTDPLGSSAPPENDDNPEGNDDNDEEDPPASSSVHSIPFPTSQSKPSDNPKRQYHPQCSQQLSQFVIDNRNKLKESRLRSRSTASTNAYECDICFSQFSHLGGLKIHRKYYGDSLQNKRLVCHVCRKKVMTPLQLLSHRKSSHRYIAWSDAAFKCEHCPLTFGTKGSLQMHLFHYHDIEHNNKSKKRRSKVDAPVVPQNIKIESSRSERKRKRDQLADERIQNVPKRSRIDRPGPKSSKSNFRTENPLVQIHAVPREVEALLSDSPMKRNKRQKLRENNEIKSLRSGTVMRQSTTNESEPKARVIEEKQATPSLVFQPSKTTTRKEALLQIRYNCQECYVPLNRIDNIIHDTEEVEDPLRSNEIISDDRSIGVQLKNLELALKKLDVPDTEEDPIKTEDVETLNPKNMIYRSSVCHRRFTTKEKLITHYLSFHTNSSQDECGVCKIRFVDSHELKTHLLLHCNKILQSKQDRSPIDSEEPCEVHRKKFLCEGCKKRFWLESTLLQHQESCELCDRPEGEKIRRTSPRKFDTKTNNIQSSAENKKTDTSRQSESCPVKKIHDQFDPWEYTKVPHATPLFPCTVCNINCQSDNTLAEHQKKFGQKDPQRCNLCGTLFPSRALLFSHMKLAHSSDSTTYQIHCPICNQGFTAKKFIRAHLWHIHHDQINNDDIIEWEDPNSGFEMKCKVCKLIFQNRKRFIEHCMYYCEEETYNCKLCNKRFLGMFRCHSHWKSEHYSKEMQLAYTHYCPVCNEGFIFQAHLHSHMFHVHDLANDAAGSNQANAKYPFVCSTCEQRFSTIMLLAHHQNLHSNDGKYRCDKCDRRCRTIPILNDHHRETHSGVPASKCPICGEGISSKTLWIAHIKHAHEKPTNQPSEFCLENMCTLKELISDSGQVSSSEIEGSNDTPGDCQSLFDEDDDLSIPEVQTANIEFNCAICDSKFSSMLELKSHKITHEDIPSKETNESPDLGHLRFILPKDPNKDLACNFEISNIYSVGLDEYEKLSNNQLQENNTTNPVESQKPENLICDICKLVFTCTKTLQNHQIRYSNTGDYVCDVCGRRFKWLKVFRSHMSKHHRKRNDSCPMYYCAKCDEAFASPNSKIMHFAHLHNDPEMKSQSDDVGGSIVDKKIVEPKSSPQINSTLTRNPTPQSTGGKQVCIEQVDLTEDEQEVASEPNPPPVARNPLGSTLSAAVKPTVSQARVQPTAHRPTEVVTNICPIVCNICRIQCMNVDFLVKHFENAHSLRLTPYKIADNPNNTYVSNLMAAKTNYQENNEDGLMNQLNTAKDVEVPPLFFYCKTCRIQFVNEYSLLTHLRSAHAKKDSVASTQDNNNWNSSDTISSGSDNRVAPLMASKVVVKSKGGAVSIETSFVNAESKVIKPDSSTTENAMDLTKKRADNIVLSRINRPYRILGGKDSKNIQLISIQKKNSVNLTQQRLQTNNSPDASNIH